MKIASILFFCLMALFFINKINSMEKEKEIEKSNSEIDSSAFDAVLINRYNDIITLKLNRGYKKISIPEIEFSDYDEATIAINTIYELNNESSASIKLNPNEACQLTNIDADDAITWLGTYRNDKYSLGKASANDQHVIYLSKTGTITPSNLNYLLIREIINDARSSGLGQSLEEDDFTAIKGTPLASNLQAREKSTRRLKDMGIDLALWHEDKELEKRFLGFTQAESSLGGIRGSAYTYKPENLREDSKPIVLAVVHGTWAEPFAEYYDPSTIDFQKIMKFAQDYADNKRASIEVVSFAWTGDNSSKGRITAGENLARLLNKFFRDYEIITLAHSHGCNVVNAASHYLDEVVIQHIIHLASPVRDKDENEKEFRPTNFNQLTHFYSTSDLVAAIGALYCGNLLAEGSIRKYEQQQGHTIYNVRTQIDAADPGHSDIRKLIPYLYSINKAIEQKYTYNNDLDLNIETKNIPTKPIIIAIRHSITIEDLFKNLSVKENVLSDAQAALIVFNKLNEELSYSKEQEDIFKILYDKNMHAKGYVPTRLLTGLTAELCANLPSLPRLGKYIGH